MADKIHPIFQKFLTVRHADPGGMHTDYIGARTSQEFANFGDVGGVEQLPPLTEDYLEWIDILESAADAQDKFVMVELGAGYGRWGVRGALAARIAGVKEIFIAFAEAEPQHVEWLKQHAINNGLEPHEFRLYEAAVSDADGSVDFYVAMPEGSPDNNAAAWYGQAKAKDYEVVAADGTPAAPKVPVAEAPQEFYVGHPVKTFASGWKAVEVRQMAATKLLKDFEVIDLLDMDVQGEEFKIVSGAMPEFNRCVKRLHIGTHSHELEYNLHQLLTAQGWRCLRAYPCASQTETPYGKVDFVDGMQTWVNPRLVPVANYQEERIYVPERPAEEPVAEPAAPPSVLTRISNRLGRMFGRRAA